MVASGALITRVPDSIDMLKCIFNGEERIYALQKQANTEIGRYQLYRVDYDKKPSWICFLTIIKFVTMMITN